MPLTKRDPFRRVAVVHIVEGGSRVWWDLLPNFNDPHPYVFQLQVGNTGLPNATDWVNVGSPVTDNYYAVDDTKRQYGKLAQTHYRLVLTTPTATYVSYPAHTLGQLDERSWVMAREVLRRDGIVDPFVAVEGWLLKRLRDGRRCTTCLDPLTNNVTNSRCPECFGTGWSTGYHPPARMCLTIQPERIKELRNGATPPGGSRQAAVIARAMAYPQLATEDIWVDANSGQRWYIMDIRHTAAIRGVPLLSDLTLQLAAYTDVVYRVPVGGETNDHPLADLPTAGEGSVRIDHDTGGEDNLAYQSADGCGVAGAIILAIPLADYQDGLTTVEHAVAATTTVANGRWSYALLLDPGEYMLVYERVGDFGPDMIELEVTAPTSSTPSDDFGAF